MIKPKILYVEDEPNLGTIVSDTLEQKGFDVLLIKDGAKVMDSFAKFSPDICVLDVMLPNVDGFELGKLITTKYPRLPIIFLTAKTQTQDVLQGFNSGATDYIRKPFSIEELVLKIEIFINRSHKNDLQQVKFYTVGSFMFDVENFTLKNDQQTFTLTPKEAKLLKYFLENKK